MSDNRYQPRLKVAYRERIRAEVGQQLGIRKSRVYELAAAGLLPVVRLGRRMRFPRCGLDELAAAAIERAKAEVLGRDGDTGPALARARAAYTHEARTNDTRRERGGAGAGGGRVA